MWSWGPHGRNGLRGWTQSDAPDHRGPREQRLVGPLRSDAATLLALQRAAGNHVVSLLVTPATRTVQRCGSDTDCGCIHDGADEAESSAARPEPRQVQRQAAGNAPELTFEPALNTPPCACVVHVHNEERKAKATARLLHTNCQYNLATVQDPAALKDRNIRVPKHGEKDPNSLFPAKVIDSCMNDEKACRDFLTAKKKSTKRADILDFAQRQYFLAIKDCSNNFAVPVVGSVCTTTR